MKTQPRPQEGLGFSGMEGQIRLKEEGELSTRSSSGKMQREDAPEGGEGEEAGPTGAHSPHRGQSLPGSGPAQGTKYHPNETLQNKEFESPEEVEPNRNQYHKISVELKNEGSPWKVAVTSSDLPQCLMQVAGRVAHVDLSRGRCGPFMSFPTLPISLRKT